ncbi:MAG: hypothetical protein KGL11_03495 [Alphaproteobacteria bacterium]|nr:hypothetical protein [Alphaproteobacteria bacterium]
MRSLTALDIAQLNRLHSKIAELESEPAMEQARKQYLLTALRREEKSLRQYNRRLHAVAGADQLA